MGKKKKGRARWERRKTTRQKQTEECKKQNGA